MEQIREVLLSRIRKVPLLNNILSITGGICQKTRDAYHILEFERSIVPQRVQQLKSNLMRFASDLVHIFDDKSIDVSPPANDPRDHLPPT